MLFQLVTCLQLKIDSLYILFRFTDSYCLTDLRVVGKNTIRVNSDASLFASALNKLSTPKDDLVMCSSAVEAFDLAKKNRRESIVVIPTAQNKSEPRCSNRRVISLNPYSAAILPVVLISSLSTTKNPTLRRWRLQFFKSQFF